MTAWIELAAETGAEGVFWDEPHLFFGEFTSLFGGKKGIFGDVHAKCVTIFSKRNTAMRCLLILQKM